MASLPHILQILPILAADHTDALRVLSAINDKGAPDPCRLGMEPTRYSYHGDDTPEEWAAVARDAVERGVPVWSNALENQPERWAEMADAYHAAGAEIGVYNQVTRDYWTPIGHYEHLAKVAGAPTDLAKLREHVRTYGPMRDWPQRQALTGHPQYQRFAADARHFAGRTGAYDAWINRVRDFVTHEDRRVSSLDLLLQSVYLFYPNHSAELAYLYALENLYWHARFVPADVDLYAVLQPEYHSQAGVYLSDAHIEAVVAAARDAGHLTGRTIGLSLWTGGDQWTAEDSRVAKSLVIAAEHGD